jgi:cation diffusion facilitator family transporter
MKSNAENLKKGQRVAFLSSFISFLLAAVKGIVGYLFNSQVLIADAFHSGADLLTHAASGFGLWIAGSSKTKKFPYGLYRAETLACLIIGGFIIMAGIALFREGYQKLFTLEPMTSFPLFPVAASMLSALSAFGVAEMESKVGKAIGSQSLLANSREAFLDIFTSMVVLLGILLAYFRIPYVEGAIIILISLLLCKLGTENVWSSLLILLDANLDPELQGEIEKKANLIYGVKGVSKVKIRQSGPFKMVECVIATRPTLTLYKAHELADKLEDAIVTNYERIESVMIHVEPLKEETVLAMIPVQNIEGLEARVAGHFARAPYFAVLKLGHDRMEIEDFYKNEFLGDNKHIGVKVARITVLYAIDLLFTSRIGEISFHMLKDQLVDIFQAKEGHSIREVIDLYHLNRLKPLISPTHTVEDAQVSQVTA